VLRNYTVPREILEAVKWCRIVFISIFEVKKSIVFGILQKKMIFWNNLWLFIEEKSNFEFFLKILTLSDLKQLMLWFQRYRARWTCKISWHPSLPIYKQHNKLQAFLAFYERHAKKYHREWFSIFYVFMNSYEKQSRNACGFYNLLII
jgi:hypothetical protein